MEASTFKIRRKATGLSQAEFALLAGVSHSTIAHFEANLHTNLQTDKLTAIVETLNKVEAQKRAPSPPPRKLREKKRLRAARKSPDALPTPTTTEKATA